MADLSVPGLATATPVLTDSVPGVRAGTGLLDCRFTFSAIRTLLQANLATVAVSGAYSSLTGLPTLGTVAALSYPSGTTNFLRADGTWAVPPGTAVSWGTITGTLSNQTDLQNALNAKAATSSLAAVATTGAYSDLSGKPTLGTVAALSYPGGTTTYLRADGTFATPPVGTGDVVGPASSVNNRVAFFSGTTGKLLADSGLTLSGSNTGDQTTVSGNAGTATTLQTARNINGVSFNGSANITVPVVPSVQSVASNATVTPTFADDLVKITAQAAALNLANPTGTAVEGWGITIRIKDNGTARAITYGTQYRAIGVTLPTTTVVNKTLYIGMIFNTTDTKWDVVSVAQEA